ncbi:MAG: hypothetical protein OXN97_13185 [Bryobacterales bacterium]|nr:hypothetical protein [Bryobacterales bacterium]
MARLDDLKRLYDLLAALEERLGGTRRLSDCSGRMDWPERGVYFFMEPGEVRADSGEGARVVRVGTHALKAGSRSTLWARLRQHRGSAKSGSGNHRGSVFRLHVGDALIARDSLACPSWLNHRNSARREIREIERPVEERVSRQIGDMPFLHLSVDDDPGPRSQRGFVERNTIALLSNFDTQNLDPPSRAWLGAHCSKEKVRASGLWNSNHVGEGYDPAFLDTFEALVLGG